MLGAVIRRSSRKQPKLCPQIVPAFVLKPAEVVVKPLMRQLQSLLRAVAVVWRGQAGSCVWGFCCSRLS